MQFFGLFMAQIWKFFQLKIPGFNMTFASLGFFLVLIPIVISFLQRLFGNGGAGTVNSALKSRANYDNYKSGGK